MMGAVTQLLGTQVTCTLQPGPDGVLASPGCAAWLEPPLAYKYILHGGKPLLDGFSQIAMVDFHDEWLSQHIRSR